MKKVGILVYDDSLVGGAENVAKNLFKELNKNYEVYMISIFQQNQSIEKDNNHYIILNQIKSITFNLFQISKKLKEYLLENEIEILIGITAGVNSVAILATHGTNIKTVYCEHSNLENKTYGKKHELRQYIGAKLMNKIVTLTKRDMKNFINSYKIKENKIECIPNWFVKQNYVSNEYDDKSLKIMTAGRLEKVKGYNMLIDIAKIVAEKHSDWHWDIYGDGKYKNEIQQKIESNHLQNFITLKGNVKDIKKRYNEYAMFVLTSYYEGLPLVLLEAQEANLPIISFDCPTGPAEIIVDKVNGYLIDCYNIEKMAERINELIENYQRRKRFSENAQININKFDKDKIILKWKNLIDNILEENNEKNI